MSKNDLKPPLLNEGERRHREKLGFLSLKVGVIYIWWKVFVERILLISLSLMFYLDAKSKDEKQ